ncbi:MAG: Gfo/Idh/MocA family oxidoreductase, partial [Lentisphaeria bacterium]
MNSGKKLQVVLVGCGGICKAWLKPTAGFDDIEIVGLVDLNLENAQKIQAEFELPAAVISDDLAKTLKDLQPDAVFDCTVPKAHCEVTLDALQHGCHVLGEKPMATNMTDARRMVEAALENDRIYAVIQNRRYLDSIIRYRDTVQDGAIGELTTLNADFYLGPHFGGFREQMKHVLLQDMAIHSFDQARFISGADAVSVYCHEWNPRGSWFSHGASAVAIFEMTNGLVFTYRGSWCAQGLPTSWQCEWRAVG